MTSSPLYPSIEPYKSEFLQVSPIHNISIKQYGNPLGSALLFIHGGPGGGTDDKDARYFDPKSFRIILFDQRGSGLSTPASCLEDNTTQDLIDDIEKIRKHLQIGNAGVEAVQSGKSGWHCFGGSWGSTLALAYAQQHPTVVLSLTLRGIFTLRRSELEFFYQGPGTNAIFPDYWEDFVAPIPIAERGDMIKAYYKRLTGSDEEERERAGTAWSTYEMATSRLVVDPEYIARAKEPHFADAFARIESHYFVNGGFMEEGSLLEKKNIDKIRNIPTTIIQGRYDMVCPMTTSWELHKVFPEATYTICALSGHSAMEDEISTALVKATNALR